MIEKLSERPPVLPQELLLTPADGAVWATAWQRAVQRQAFNEDCIQHSVTSQRLFPNYINHITTCETTIYANRSG
jgi:hypothetical protein